MKTVRELREARGESRSDLAAAVGVTLSELTDWEMGTAEPGVARMRLLTEHFGVRDDQINLEPNRPPTIGERLLLVGRRPCRLGGDAQLAGGADVLWTDARGSPRLVSCLADGAGTGIRAVSGLMVPASTARDSPSSVRNSRTALEHLARLPGA